MPPTHFANSAGFGHDISSGWVLCDVRSKLAALIASSAELSTFSRNLHHLTKLLRHGEFRPAQEYRPMLDTLGADVRSHLALVAGALADLRPRGGTAATGPSANN